MDLTAQDKALFEALRTTELGRFLADYVDRLTDEMCDIRTMEGVSEAERLGRVEASKFLAKYLIDPVRKTRPLRKRSADDASTDEFGEFG